MLYGVHLQMHYTNLFNANDTMCMLIMYNKGKGKMLAYVLLTLNKSACLCVSFFSHCNQ